MRIKTTSRLVTIGVIILTVLSLAAALVSLELRREQEKAYGVRLEALKMVDQLADGSDRLTSAIRGYAATGDRLWWDAYQKELNADRTRDTASERLQALSLTSEELELVRRAKQNSDTLVHLETQAADEVAKGQLAAATRLVFGEPYRVAKDSIMQPLADCRRQLEQRLTSQAEELSGQARTAAAVAIGILLLNTVALVCALLLFYGRRVIAPLLRLSQNLQELVQGDSEAVVGYQSDPSEIGDVARSFETYRLAVDEAERQRWVKTRVMEIADTLQEVEQPEDFGTRLLGRVVPLLGGGCGAFYLLEDQSGQFVVRAGYSLGEAQHDIRFSLGEGVAGQAATEQKAIVLTDLPDDYVRVSSGLGEARPRVLAIVPIVVRKRTTAVVEIAAFTPLTGPQRALLDEVSATVALKLDVLLRNLHTRALLEQVKSSEERSRLILESTAEGIFGVDTEGHVTFINAAACRMLGYAADELLGQATHARFHYKRADGSDYALESCPMYAAYKDGKAIRVDDECLWRKDGSAMPVEYGAIPIRKDDVLVGAVISFRDITERKAADQALRQANFLSDMALELTNAGYWHVDYSDPDYYYQSERAARIVGEEIKPDGRYHLQDEWFSRVIEADKALADLTAERYAGAIEGRYESYDVIYAYKRPIDGRIVYLHALGSLVRDENGKARFMYGVYQDITEAKRQEAELKESEDRLRETEQFYRSVLELAPDGLMVVDAHGIVELANARCEALFGYTRTELIGQAVETLVPADARAHHPGLRTAFHDAPEVRAMAVGRELRAVRKSGEEFPVEIGLSALPGRPGEAPRVALSIRDITDRKRAETELVAAREKAEEATQMKSMFLANMSHEIRTPMNAIIGLSHLALKTELSPKQRDYVSKVHNAGTSLLAIINDILDFSKVEAGKLDLESIDFRIDEVISSVTTLTAQKAHEKGLEFLAHVSTETPEGLRGDPLRLAQILTNLVNNAVKFTERGEIRVSIELLERTGEKVQLKFAVRDTGPGMTPEQSARLFQPFTQADMSTTRKHGGTGLGLTISRRLVELMGGTIWLESEAGVGTTFYFTVWLGIGSARGRGYKVPARIAQLRALVVDDNPAAREILQEPLLTLASKVDVVASGKEAIAAVATHDATEPYDVVFMDWRMPGMDGLQASRYIKSDETLRHPPAIVLVTAFGREEVREEAERLQLDGFLVKPVTRSMIVDTLVNVFTDPSDAQESRVAAGSSVSLRGMRILLTEDNEINQQIAVELLEAVGATVTVANHGREAVDLLLEGPQPPPFDVVLMDLQMPVMDGHTATARIRGESRLARLPIIAMTAHATLEERHRCLENGMNDHISKPIDPDALYETLARYLPRGGPAPATSDEAGADGALRAGVEPQEGAPTLGAGPDDDAPTAADEGPAIDAIEGLQAADGLRRVAGNRKLYVKILRQFVDRQAGAVAEIEQARASGDRGLAERLAHTLKGVAGNIGAVDVQKAAGEVESRIRVEAPDEEVTPALHSLTEALTPLVAALRAVLIEDAPPAAAAQAFDVARLRDVGQRLLGFVVDSNPDASSLLESEESVLRTLFGDDWASAQQAVSDFDFMAAEEMLQRALEKLPPA